ncbi:MAG: DUF5597 domain-containing protein, partial [Labilibaculum sp.]|nr:DUF5597 domain-containing protein [Labilibaculum sp.]
MKIRLLKSKIVSVLILMLIFSITLNGQSKKRPHLKNNGNATQLIIEGEPSLLLCGELGNSSSTTLEYLDLAFEKCKKLGLNSVLATISWDQFEPVEGQFNYNEIDGLIKNAEKHDLKLVIIWFAAWKNGYSSYAPEWVKKDRVRFPRVIGTSMERLMGGKDTSIYNKNTLSPFFEETWKADAKAFAKLMKRIKQIDENQTVVMVQVENEVGTYGVALDQQPKALKLFNGPVPKQLTQYLKKHVADLVPAMTKAWNTNGNKMEGSWDEVFGTMAIDAFMAWHFAGFLEQVTVAGKAEYDIPMFYNAWLKQPKHDNMQGRYPTGGPIHTVLDVYRAASPSVDLLSPDIYHPAFKQYCEAYDHPGNVLFIPECRIDEAMVGKAYWTIAEKDGIGFAPFGIERVSEESSLVEGYRILDQLMPLITERQGTDKLMGIYRQVSPSKRKVDVGMWDFDAGDLEMEDKSYTKASIGEWIFNVQFMRMFKDEPAFGLILQLSDDEFIITGKNLRFEFAHKDKSLRVEQVY